MMRSNVRGSNKQGHVASDERIPRLCAAPGRTTLSLDPDTVLREVVDGAADFPGARYGSIVTIDGSGPPGLPHPGRHKKQHRAMAVWPTARSCSSISATSNARSGPPTSPAS